MPRPLVELLPAADRILPHHGVGDEQDLARSKLGAQLAELPHQLFVNVESPGAVDQQHVVAAVGGVLAGRAGQRQGFIETFTGKAGNADLLRDDGQLLAGRRASHVNRNQHGVLALFFQPLGELAGRCSLAAALQADQQKYRGQLARKENL